MDAWIYSKTPYNVFWEQGSKAFDFGGTDGQIENNLEGGGERPFVSGKQGNNTDVHGVQGNKYPKGVPRLDRWQFSLSHDVIILDKQLTDSITQSKI